MIKKSPAFILLIFAFSLSKKATAQGVLFFTNGDSLYIGEAPYKSENKLYFRRFDTLFWVKNTEIQYQKKYRGWQTSSAGITYPILDTLRWNDIPAKLLLSDFSKSNFIRKYANQSKAGIFMTLVIPAITGAIAFQTGVIELVYLGLTSSTIGVGIWINGINQLQTALEISEAAHFKL